MTQNQVKAAYDKPIDVLKKIGATLPKPAAFFINFIIIKARSVDGWMGWVNGIMHQRLAYSHIADTTTPATNHTQALTGLPSELMRATSYMQHLVKILFMYVCL